MSSEIKAQHPPLPDPKEVAKTYAEVAQRASKLLHDHIQRQVKKGVSAPQDELGLAQAFMDMMAKMLANPYKLAQAQMNLVWDYFSLWQHSTMRFMGVHGAPIAAPVRGDNRFRGEAWEEHFLFDFIKQSYLITARHIHDSVSTVEGLDDKTQGKVNFFTRQFIDALSPSNFVMTNPEVFNETVKSHGQNLIKGFNNLLRDIEEGDGQLRVKMTDTTAFELGKNVATTPGKVVFQNELFQLLQFTPSTKQQFKRPLLIVPPWINKYYILDLREKNSYIKWATDQGHSVFCISWVNPDEKLAQKGFEDYLLDGALTAIEQVCEQTGEKEINAVGYHVIAVIPTPPPGANAVHSLYPESDTPHRRRPRSCRNRSRSHLEMLSQAQFPQHGQQVIAAAGEPVLHLLQIGHRLVLIHGRQVPGIDPLLDAPGQLDQRADLVGRRIRVQIAPALVRDAYLEQPLVVFERQRKIGAEMRQRRDHPLPVHHALPGRTSLAHQAVLGEKQDAVLGMGQMCVGRNPAGSRYGVFGVHEDIGRVQVDAQHIRTDPLNQADQLMGGAVAVRFQVDPAAMLLEDRAQGQEELLGFFQLPEPVDRMIVAFVDPAQRAAQLVPACLGRTRRSRRRSARPRYPPAPCGGTDCSR